MPRRAANIFYKLEFGECRYIRATTMVQQARYLNPRYVRHVFGYSAGKHLAAVLGSGQERHSIYARRQSRPIQTYSYVCSSSSYPPLGEKLEYIRVTVNVAKTAALLPPGHAPTAAETTLYGNVWVSAVASNRNVVLECQ